MLQPEVAGQSLKPPQGKAKFVCFPWGCIALYQWWKVGQGCALCLANGAVEFEIISPTFTHLMNTRVFFFNMFVTQHVICSIVKLHYHAHCVQEPVLFSCSVAENIAYGAEDPSTVTTEEIEKVAEIANAATFIQNFPKGFDTLVGEKGVLLSGTILQFTKYSVPACACIVIPF